MSVASAIKQFESLTEFIQGDFLDFASGRAASNTVALITDRIQSKGENFKGQKFSPYSETPLSKDKLIGAFGTSGSDRKVEQAFAEGRRLSYREFRELNGLQTRHKDFTLTTEMLRNFGIKSSQRTLFSVETTRGGLTAESQRKIDANSEQEGVSIIENNKSEADRYESDLEKELLRKIQEIFNV